MSTNMPNTPPMNNIVYRILNPALNPPQVVFEHHDEQTTLRDYAARHDAHTQGLIISKSEDGGRSWVGVPVRAPDVAVPLAAQAAAAVAPSHPGQVVPPGIAPSVGSVTAAQAAAAQGTPPVSPIHTSQASPSQASPSVAPVAPPVVTHTGRLEEADHHGESKGSTKHRK